MFVDLVLHNARKSKDRVRVVHVGLVQFIIPPGGTATLVPETERNAKGYVLTARAEGRRVTAFA